MLFNVNRGNLAVNGGFEQGLAGWSGICNVGIEGLPFAYEGLVAAAMGKPDNLREAVMFQDVPIPARRTFVLKFFVSGVALNPADLTVDVLWLAPCGNVICSALAAPVFAPGETTGPAAKGGYKAVVSYTERAPASAAWARIIFHKAPGAVQDNFLLLDNVIFVMQ
ncbi:MAG TPA: hypothetical protein GX529_03760 [Firmicutes bacterium]|nr:hypothetical protein [Candidatus Fermentithermobacillaceae bacterium]